MKNTMLDFLDIFVGLSSIFLAMTYLSFSLDIVRGELCNGFYYAW